MKSVYVASNRLGVVKIGSSNNPSKRMKAVRCEFGRRCGVEQAGYVDFYLAFETGPIDSYLEVERLAHRYMKKKFVCMGLDYYLGAKINDAVKAIALNRRNAAK
jgi:hypothetical protein